MASAILVNLRFHSLLYKGDEKLEKSEIADYKQLEKTIKTGAKERRQTVFSVHFSILKNGNWEVINVEDRTLR